MKKQDRVCISLSLTKEQLEFIDEIKDQGHNLSRTDVIIEGMVLLHEEVKKNTARARGFLGVDFKRGA